MQRVLGSFLQLLGIATLAVGAWLLAPWLGFVVAGVGVFAIGLQLERLAA